jgi:predicted TIM-barrel fold metal-dependent hydrolase
MQIIDAHQHFWRLADSYEAWLAMAMHFHVDQSP